MLHRDPQFSRFGVMSLGESILGAILIIVVTTWLYRSRRGY